MSIDQQENTDNPILVCSIQPTYSCNIDKALDVIAQNSDSVIILSSGVAIAFVLFGLGHGISLVVAQLKLKQ